MFMARVSSRESWEGSRASTGHGAAGWAGIKGREMCDEKVG